MACNCQKKKLPPKTEMAKNVVKSVVENVKQVFTAGGKIFADRDVIRDRMVICLKCEYLLIVNHEKRCSECGCFINTKIGLQVEKCPKGKW